MNIAPLLLGGAGLALLSSQSHQKKTAQQSHDLENQLRLAKLNKAITTRIARDKLKPFDAETSELTLAQLLEDPELQLELRRMQMAKADADEIDTFLIKFIQDRAEEERRAKSYWPKWPDWLGIAVVGGVSALTLGPELLMAYGLTGHVGLIDMAFAAWQISDLMGYAAEGSQAFTASLLSDAWIGSRITPATGFFKIMGIAIVEGGIIHEAVMKI